MSVCDVSVEHVISSEDNEVLLQLNRFFFLVHFWRKTEDSILKMEKRIENSIKGPLVYLPPAAVLHSVLASSPLDGP